MRGLITFSLLLSIILLSGCATPTPIAEMVPAAVSSPQSLHAVSIIVVDVTGGMETKSWDVPRIGNAEFKQALIETLQKAGARTGTANKEENGYTLTCEIVSQNIAGTFDNTITLLVHYNLKNRGGERIWAENIFSEKELSVKDVFGGQERIRKLQTSAVQSNFATLIEKLAKAIEIDRHHKIKSE